MNTDKISGVLIFVSFVLTLYSYFFNPSFLIFASMFLWVSFGLFFHTLKNKKLLISLFALGLIFLLFVLSKGYKVDMQRALSINQYLLALLIAVGFLRLVATPKADKDESLPKGKRAYLKTYFGVHLFGSVINLSSLIIAADKLYKKAKLTDMQIIALTRSFASDALWSPFFVAFGAAITYAPKLDMSIILVNGLTLTLIAFLFSYMQISSKKYDIEAFTGYPLSFDALYVPILLTSLVLVTNYLYSNVKIIVLIALFAFLLTFVILPIKKGFHQGFMALRNHITDELPKMKGEISLFLVAGFFGMSVSFLLMGYHIGLPFEVFDWKVASLFLTLCLGLGIVGIHPIITLAVVGDLLANVNNTLLAASFLIAWALNVSASPFSGLNLTISARYNVDTIRIFKLNFVYTLFIYTASIICLFVLDVFVLR